MDVEALKYSGCPSTGLCWRTCRPERTMLSPPKGFFGTALRARPTLHWRLTESKCDADVRKTSSLIFNERGRKARCIRFVWPLPRRGASPAKELMTAR
eukprot:scaffold13242_cov15-Prasinocladus_malaysianus.AAC.2